MTRENEDKAQEKAVDPAGGNVPASPANKPSTMVESEDIPDYSRLWTGDRHPDDIKPQDHPM